MSPMSDLAHLGLLIMPMFCLARLAIFNHDRMIAAIVAAAAIAALAVNKDLFGATAYTVVLWAGVATGGMLALWVNCVAALMRGCGEPPAEGFAGSILPLVRRRNARTAIAVSVGQRRALSGRSHAPQRQAPAKPKPAPPR